MVRVCDVYACVRTCVLFYDLGDCVETIGGVGCMVLVGYSG